MITIILIIHHILKRMGILIRIINKSFVTDERQFDDRQLYLYGTWLTNLENNH